MINYDFDGLHPATKKLYKQLDRSVEKAMDAAAKARAEKNAPAPWYPEHRTLTDAESKKSEQEFRFATTVAIVVSGAVALFVVWLTSRGFRITTTHDASLAGIAGIVAGGITCWIMFFDGIQNLLCSIRRHPVVTIVLVGIVVALLMCAA